MKHFKSTWAIIFLCIYTALLLHDFAPHQHSEEHSHTETAHHEPHGDHGHSNEEPIDGHNEPKADLFHFLMEGHVNATSGAHHSSTAEIIVPNAEKQLKDNIVQVKTMLNNFESFFIKIDEGPFPFFDVPPDIKSEFLLSNLPLRAPPVLG